MTELGFCLAGVAENHRDILWLVKLRLSDSSKNNWRGFFCWVNVPGTSATQHTCRKPTQMRPNFAAMSFTPRIWKGIKYELLGLMVQFSILEACAAECSNVVTRIALISEHQLIRGCHPYLEMPVNDSM